MTDHRRIELALTKEEHDFIVALRGRPVTDPHMREARRYIDDGTDSGPSLVDQYLNYSKGKQ